jgi:chemosensory pili system protein ChpA (sensor histidine kinase/response regulator)
MPKAGEALKLFEHQVEALTAVPVQPTAVTVDLDKIDAAPEELQEIPDVVLQVSEPEVSGEPSEESVTSQHIRVNADLLDSLVNSAGEISIFRSRLEQEVGSVRDNLKEFDETVSRLREQFRKLEIETETQIRSRYQQEAPAGSEEFDPLEMDRFSSMQQLSRSLSESVSDLLNLQELLDEATRKSEALLVQQSRVSTELQEGLMQTRMVHFGTIAPRLRRIIRTAASETRKKARLQLRMTGGGDQLDRNVLERITAPLEHLLRNAIVHGIEKPAVRRKLEKPEEGELSITVAAEATEFVVRVEDDGAGLNLAAIHKRALEQGLVDKDTDPQPQQLLQLILHSGFSTSETVTALAGRGVGMDVVNSEIKQIGGSIEIESEEGKGSCFTIRIPFTLAVMQAIGVKAGEHQYLIPVASVAGVARVMPADYQALLEQDNPVYHFAGDHYAVLELEPLLGEPATPLGEDTISILMIKTGKHRAAFRVPELLGHREIVIKPIGPQISSVPGILGGTITGDGQVVVIIDTGPLIRQALLTGSRPAPPMESIDIRPRKTLAMVVDDSITMRKVTTRVLEGNDFEVLTAKDGVDATEQMQERIPDLLLLDVEMPRMDGYELAEYVRADARLRHIPIIMITSRAGRKHRKRGMKAGANVYLSKPYRESDLLSEVTQLLDKGKQ